MAAIIYAQAVFGIVPLGALDPSARQMGVGWRALAAEIDALRKQTGAQAVLTTSYAATAWLSLYLPSRVPVVQVNERIRWVNAPPPDEGVFRGPLLYVCKIVCGESDIVRRRYRKFEEIARLPRTRRGVEIETYAVYRVDHPNGDPLDRSPPRELAPK